ncbi:MAG TPA: hypothetical protein VIK65_03145 [Candidatus Limnocylindrales bacterium]|jgi:hypothetical protein
MSDPIRPSDPFAPPPADQPAAVSSAGVAPPPVASLPVAPVDVRRRSGAATLVNVLLGIALVVAVGGVAFAAGRATAPSSVAATGRNGFGNGQFGFGPNASGAPDRGGFGGFGGFAGAGGVSLQGTVTAVGSDSITLQLASGQSLTIPLDAQTTYHSRTSATAADVTNGATVIVQLTGGGRGLGLGLGNGQGNQGNGQGNQNPAASGGPAAGGGAGRGLGSASSVTIVPPGS